jgi:hypothetical protein
VNALRSELIIEFLRRSYFAADGLWFVICQQELGYDEAMRLDELVWKVMPKIQARKAREVLALEGDPLSDLASGLALKFAAEDYGYLAKPSPPGSLRLVVDHCPWKAAIRNAGREAIMPDICSRICHPEMRIWGEEFSMEISFEMEADGCNGDEPCSFLFRHPGGSTAEREASPG